MRVCARARFSQSVWMVAFVHSQFPIHLANICSTPIARCVCVDRKVTVAATANTSRCPCGVLSYLGATALRRRRRHRYGLAALTNKQSEHITHGEQRKKKRKQNKTEIKNEWEEAENAKKSHAHSNKAHVVHHLIHCSSHHDLHSFPFRVQFVRFAVISSSPRWPPFAPRLERTHTHVDSSRTEREDEKKHYDEDEKTNKNIHK